MILTIKAKQCKQLPDGSWQITTNVENFKEALGNHSPNILVDYLNEHFPIKIAAIKKKGGSYE